jgi:DNA-binding MarR family transcriptional regulator
MLLVAYLRERRDALCDLHHIGNHCEVDIFAGVQPIAQTAQADRLALTRDMYALVSYLMRSSNVGAFNLIAELELSFTQIKALCAMDVDNENRSVKALAESMHVSLPAMSRAVDGLYERGFVDRKEDPVDRRMKRIRLTEAGRTITSSLNEARLTAMQEFLLALSDEEAHALTQALSLILESRAEIAELRPSRNGISS